MRENQVNWDSSHLKKKKAEAIPIINVNSKISKKMKTWFKEILQRHCFITCKKIKIILLESLQVNHCHLAMINLGHHSLLLSGPLPIIPQKLMIWWMEALIKKIFKYWIMSLEKIRISKVIKKRMKSLASARNLRILSKII